MCAGAIIVQQPKVGDALLGRIGEILTVRMGMVQAQRHKDVKVGVHHFVGLGMNAVKVEITDIFGLACQVWYA